MGRPVKQKVDYFPHYVKGGRTLFVLEEKYGNDGYAFWFKLLELLCDSEGHFIDCRNAPNWEFLLAKTHTEADKAEQIIATLVNLGKIDPDLWAEKVIWVQNLLGNLASVYERRKEPLPEKPLLNQTETPAETNKCEQKPQRNGINVNRNTQRRVEESKVEESRGKYPYQDIARLWNETCTNLPQVKSVGDKRKQKIKARLSEFGKDPEQWLSQARELFERVQASKFLCGGNGNGWTASFDWIFENESNWVKVMEGNYDNDRGSKGAARKRMAQAGATLGVGEYIDENTGRRTYGSGKATIPMNAPARPSERHAWDEQSKTWVLL